MTRITDDQSEDATMKPVSSRFADFIRNASAEQKAEVYGRVMDKVCEQQRAVIAAAQAEPEWDRGPLTEPAELYDDAAFAEFDRLRNVNKGPKLARREADHALDLQIQMQGAIGELPR